MVETLFGGSFSIRSGALGILVWEELLFWSYLVCVVFTAGNMLVFCVARNLALCLEETLGLNWNRRYFLFFIFYLFGGLCQKKRR